MASYTAQIEAHLRLLEPRLRKAFLDSVRLITSDAQLALIAWHLDRGDIEGAVRSLHIEPAAFAAFDEAIRAAYIAGGIKTLELLPALKEPAGLGKLLSALTAGPSGRRRT